MTHYTCDRCGQPADTRRVKGVATTVIVDDWKGDGSRPPRAHEIFVNTTMTGVGCDYDHADHPDLCNDCRAHILMLAAATLTPAPECVP